MSRPSAAATRLTRGTPVCQELRSRWEMGRVRLTLACWGQYIISCRAINLDRGDIIRNMSRSHSSPVTSPTMIGREAQLVLVTDLLTQASSGQSRIALVAGEVGIGKSRLVGEIKARATQ